MAVYRILVVGAHPDDCDIFAGGTAALWKRRGDTVRFLSVTNGEAGHQSMGAEELAARRRREAEKAAEVLGIEYVVLGNPDGQLVPTLERRFDMIRRIREFAPDLVLTHRPWDYHPDHRYTATLVLDSAYMVTVPRICPEVPHLESNPVPGYLHDDFRRPVPFEADVVVDVDEVMELKWEILHAHTSQFYEWLPYNTGKTDQVPAEDGERRRWLRSEWEPLLGRVADDHRVRLSELYGEERARGVRFAEAFEIGEHGRRPAGRELEQLFPLGA